MAYLVQSISGLASLPAAVKAFASSLGWAVGSTLDQVTTPSGTTWEFLVSITATDHRLDIRDIANTATRAVWTKLPKTAGTFSAPVIGAATKLHLFGNPAPYAVDGGVAPYVAGVIECGFNSYRHFFIGKTVKIGDYTGGDLLSANYFNADNLSASSMSVFSESNKYLFSARHRAASGSGPVLGNSGGVLLSHVDNPNPWRRFYGPVGSGCRLAFVGDEVFGGHMDAVNSGLIRRGVAPYAGANILTPVNLYAARGSGVSAVFAPIGHVPNTALIDMRGLEPGAQIDVAGSNWRAFPEFSKQTVTSVLRNNLGYWWDAESSQNLGMAYKE